MGEFSITHIVLVLVIFLIFFGPSKLPQLGQSLGKAIKNFKQGMNEASEETRAPVKPSENDRLHSEASSEKNEAGQTTDQKTKDKV